MEESHSEFRIGSGLVIHEEYQFLVATPDGVTHCSCCGHGVLEVKCPFCTKVSDTDMAKFLKMVLYRGTISTTTKYRHRCLYVTWLSQIS